MKPVELTLREKKLIYLTLGLLLPLLIYTYVLVPLWRDYQVKEQQLKTQGQHLAQLQLLARNQVIFQTTEELAENIMDLERAIPPEPAAYELLYELDVAANRAGLKLQDVEFALDPSVSNFGVTNLTALTVQMKITGAYSSVRQFFDELQSLDRLSIIQSYNLKGSQVLTGVIKITSFSYPVELPNLPFQTKVPKPKVTGKSKLLG